jgi:hypothetical protein
MWMCGTCQEMLEDTFDACWKCGTSRTGPEDPVSRPEKTLMEPKSDRATVGAGPLTCARCSRELDYVGRKRFHEGTNWGVLGEVGEWFVKRQHFDVYVCPRCGRVEFFVDGIGEELRPQ